MSARDTPCFLNTWMMGAHWLSPGKENTGDNNNLNVEIFSASSIGPK